MNDNFVNKNIFTKVSANINLHSEQNNEHHIDQNAGSLLVMNNKYNFNLEPKEGLIKPQENIIKNNVTINSSNKYSLSSSFNNLNKKLSNVDKLLSDSEFLDFSTTKENLFGRKLNPDLSPQYKLVGGNEFSSTSEIPNGPQFYSETSDFNNMSFDTHTLSSFNVPKNKHDYSSSSSSSSFSSSSSSSSSLSSYSSISSSPIKKSKNKK